ncbi:carboxypeptidase regulatory-like domain-containing protein [Streptomonospora sp. PA3]|uniref:carboxypeptidase-like regulatory domain-containing protein n=1 Tax=Streptomonospora sp. PA3 TaxID=2607326 RepID=UPI0012DCE1D8|nr:carboxypeptidase-like regulatory domain-containing protein [Streptomonospora sp. PA3]MUL40572.1 carboxypeptidase regulatory-like domain-containing protein [Streptomonospora sp. PA3]
MMRGRRVAVVAAVAAVCGLSACGLGARPVAGSGGDGAEPAGAGAVERDTGVRGRVVREGGAVGAHCLLHARAASVWAPPVPEAAVISDARGRFFRALPAGTYTLSARCGGEVGRVDQVAVAEGEVAAAIIVVE